MDTLTATLIAIAGLAGVGAVGSDGQTAAAPLDPVEYGDWTVTCDNTGACTAVNVSKARAAFAETEWGEAGVAVLRIEQGAGPHARPRVFLDKRLWGATPSSSRFTRILDREPGVDEPATRSWRLQPLVRGLQEVDPWDVDSLLAYRGEVIFFATPSGNPAMPGSIAGLSDVVAHIARERTVPRPSAAAPVRAVRPAAGTQARDVPDDEVRERGLLVCGVTAAPHTGQAWRLSNGQMLWQVYCGDEDPISHAENPRSAWFVAAPRNRPRLYPFPTASGDPATGLSFLPNGGFDPVSGLLTATSFDSPGVDCGWQRSWAWTGSAWQLVRERKLQACMGVTPEGWPTVWRRQVR